MNDTTTKPSEEAAPAKAGYSGRAPNSAALLALFLKKAEYAAAAARDGSEQKTPVAEVAD